MGSLLADEEFFTAEILRGAGGACETDIEESDIHHCMNASWLFGGVDMERWLEFKAAQPQQFGEFMQRGRERLRLFDKPWGRAWSA
jgi:hypothetical protein